MVFVCDAKEGVHPLDQEFASIIRKSKKPVILVANKVDRPIDYGEAHDFYSLGIGEPIPVSSENGSGTGDLLDAICNALPPDKGDLIDDNIPKFAIVGRPNAGKSSIVNALLGKENNIVTPVAGTTRDTVHTRFSAFGLDLYLLDTAGLRKKSKVHEDVEFYSTLRALKAIEECDVALLVIDAERGLEAQDLHILLQIEKEKKGLVILINKWDLVEKTHKTAIEMQKEIEEKILPLSNVPIIFVSATTKQRILKSIETAVEVYRNLKLKIPTHELNEKMLESIAAYQPPSDRGKMVRIKYVVQTNARTPTFLFFANSPLAVKENYKRYLENQLRLHYGFQGVPLTLVFKEK